MLKRKIAQYFNDHPDILRCQLAERIGINIQIFSDIGKGRRCVPKKYWKSFVEHFDGYVTFADIFIDFFEEYEFLDICPWDEGRKVIVGINDDR